VKDLELTADAANRLAAMRALVVTNLYPSEARPRLGRFVRDQVEEIRRLGAEVDVFTFPLGARSYLKASRDLRKILRSTRYDVIHAHYGLCGWVAERAGADPLVVTFHGTDIRHPAIGPLSRRVARRAEIAAGVSLSCFRREAGRRGLPLLSNAAVLPCGVDTARFRPGSKNDARRSLGLDPDGRYLLLPADPDRTVKRADRARLVAEDTDSELLTAGEVDPERMPELINASSAVLITSDNEGFGLAALESLACGVPVLSTPVGVAPFAVAGVEGCLVGEFDRSVWAEAARVALEQRTEPIHAMDRIGPFTARRMAQRVLSAWEGMIDSDSAEAEGSMFRKVGV
jgi:glycosyltransferase involved in cell wall biosynthesis